jgi:hypothetical protein
MPARRVQIRRKKISKMKLFLYIKLFYLNLKIKYLNKQVDKLREKCNKKFLDI